METAMNDLPPSQWGWCGPKNSTILDSPVSAPFLGPNWLFSFYRADILLKCSSDLQTTLNLSNRQKGVPFNFHCSTTVAWRKLTSLYFWSVETMKISPYAQARQLPLCQAQSSVWNRLIFLNNFLMLLHKLNEKFRANGTWISDCRACSIFKSVPMSQDSKEYA